MALSIVEGRPTSRPASPALDRVVLTARGAGYCAGVHGEPMRPAPFRHQAAAYLAGYLTGWRDATIH